MFPIGDDDTGVRTLPVVTYALIAANVLFFLVELNGGDDFIRNWSFIPANFSENPAASAPTIFTAMFMHGGWMHLLGNMLYLWIFGDNVEDRLGAIPFLIFYLVCGIAATFLQYYFNEQSTIPNLGASGAIAGVLGAYIIMFPGQSVRVIVLNQLVMLPALVVIGVWIALQLFSGVGAIANTDANADTGGVAYMAHVGGFVAGLAIAFLIGGRGGPSRTA